LGKSDIELNNLQWSKIFYLIGSKCNAFAPNRTYFTLFKTSKKLKNWKYIASLIALCLDRLCLDYALIGKEAPLPLYQYLHRPPAIALFPSIDRQTKQK
jgi:hypothetical protein